ncbi:hypothetical protein BKA63DRAFT_570001 [Paraphoma chrysanthemicola]|nr:hypothetical protein BKA63DRAFT_570001 [Paraphoma chrysanthemicola]
MRHLKQFILCVHLYTGNVQRVFAQSLSTVEEVLRATINVVYKYYKDNGGVENVPDMHRLGDIDEDYLNDEIRTIVGRPNGRVVPPRRRRKDNGVAPPNRAVDAAPNHTRGSRREHPMQMQQPEARSVQPAPSNRKRQLSPVFEDVDADHAEDMDGVSMTGVTEVIVGSKRQAEEYSLTEAIWVLKRKKQKIAAAARELQDAMKARAEEKKRLDDAMEEIMDNMSPEELKAFIRKFGANDDDEMVLEDDRPAVD